MLKDNKIIYSIDELSSTASQVLEAVNGYKIILFSGEMGTGKTTLIKEIVSQLGVEMGSSSPTFSVVNEYEGAELIYHMDLYRVESIAEAEEFGIYEYLNGENYCFIEWPDLIEPLLSGDFVKISLFSIDTNKREMRMKFPDEH